MAMKLQTILFSVALGGAFFGGLACGSLTDALNEEECISDSDCGGKLGCVVPAPVSSVGGDAPINVGIGWCLEQSTCVPGAQPYCPCAADAAGLPVCSNPPYGGDRMVTQIQMCQNPDVPSDCWCVPPGACPESFAAGP